MGNILKKQRYELKEELGVGGQASVFKAIEKETNRLVALKVFKEEFNPYNISEADICKKVDHAYILPFIEAFTDQFNKNSLCIVNELAERGNLVQYMESFGNKGPS